MIHRYRIILIILAGVLLYTGGVAVRRTVLEAQYSPDGSMLPFTLESALQFRMVRQVYDQGHIPEVDVWVQHPEGVRPAETYSLGAEYVYAAVARLMPSSITLAERVRWISVLWFCLGIPLVMLWVWGINGRISGGVVAALFYAIELSAVIRSTGQELSRENFALPFLVGHLASSVWAGRVSRRALFLTVLSAVLLGLALMNWDMIQFYILLWAVWGAARVIWQGRPGGEAWRSYLVHGLVLVLCGCVNPYLRAHAWTLSPLMGLIYGVLLAGWLLPSSGQGRQRLMRLFCVLLPILVLAVWSVRYQSSYGHFAELLWAKIRFLNQKPADPTQLGFLSRIMWVPALHSATMPETFMLFPAMLVLTFIGIWVLSVQQVTHPNSRLIQQLVFCGASLIAFVLFVRFHVYLALFSTAVIGSWWAQVASRRGWIKWVAVSALLAGGLLEIRQTVTEPWRWGRSEVYYGELRELLDWMNAQAASQVVVGNFGVSAAICAYADCPIVLHPKFETREIRERVRQYGEVLFKSNEQAFRDWADDLNVAYYVHSLGEYSSTGPEYQMRYFVDALEPGADTAAWMFEKNPGQSRYFQQVWGNGKYRVFKMLTREQQHQAERLADEAQGFLQQGELTPAEERAMDAITADRYNAKALEVLRHVSSLRAQSFGYEGSEAGAAP